MAVSKEILDLIPEGCKVNWNEKQQRFYVYKSIYYYSKEHKRSREQRTQIGTIVNGVFTYAKSYLLKQQIKDLKQEVKASTADVVNKTSEILSDEIVDPRRRFNTLWPTCIWSLCSAPCPGRQTVYKSLIIGATIGRLWKPYSKTFPSRIFLTILFAVFSC